MVRSIFAVLLGWAAVGVLVVATDTAMMKMYPDQYVHGQLPPDYLVWVSLLTSTLWSVLGGYVTARLAPRKVWHHILGLAIWGELMGVASAIATWGQVQTWYQIGLLVLWAPAVALGGWLRAGSRRPWAGSPLTVTLTHSERR